MKQIINKQENEKLQDQKENQIATANLLEEHEKAIAEISEQFKAKLIIEYQKYDNLEDKYNSIKKSFDKKMEEMELQTKEELKKMQDNFKVKLATNELEVSVISLQLFLINKFCFRSRNTRK